MPDDNGDEADGRDEILCPTDLDWDDPLRDDWLRTTFDGLRAGVNLTVIMDCCHSGTNTRAILPPDAPIKERYLPSPWSLKAVESGRSLPKKVTSELRRSPRAARKTKDIVKAELPEVLITGCRDTQTSADAFINGRYNGALTFALVDAIRKSKGRLTYQGAARSRVGRAQDEEVRSGAAARRPDGRVRPAAVFRVGVGGNVMKASSEKRLQQLHPALAAAVRAAIADLAAKGTVVEVVQGLRTFEEQDELYAKGRTTPGPIVTQARGGESNHNFGLAVDLCPFTNDKPDWNAPMAVWAAIGTAAMAHGLEWGGQWKKFLDKPHVQLPSMTVKECASCYQDRRTGRRLVRRLGRGSAGQDAPPRESRARTKAQAAQAVKRKIGDEHEQAFGAGQAAGVHGR